MTDIVVETEAPEDKAPAAKPPADKETKRMKQALAALQKERDDLKAAASQAAEEAKRASMTELEKYKADAEARGREVEAARKEAATAKAERERERLVSKLVAKHKLADPDYGDLVLRTYDPAAHEDFDAFVEEAKKEPKIRHLFASGKALDDDGEEIIPNATAVSTKTKKSAASEDLIEFAKSMFPNDTARQKSYLDTVRSLRGS